jgi:membrane protein YdbS with pleckstrin-like domain
MVKSSSNGIGLGTVLFIVFLILKLTGNINWSWWWVTSPLWIPLAFIVIALFIIGVFVVIAKRDRL